MDSCSNCGVRGSLQTHYINEQAKANENGIIKHFHKNIRHNLIIFRFNFFSLYALLDSSLYPLLYV